MRTFLFLILYTAMALCTEIKMSLSIRLKHGMWYIWYIQRYTVNRNTHTFTEYQRQLNLCFVHFYIQQQKAFYVIFSIK